MASPSEMSSRLLNIFHKNIVYTFSFYQREECFISKVHFTRVILYKNPIFFLYLQIITLHFMQVIFSINAFLNYCYLLQIFVPIYVHITFYFVIISFLLYLILKNSTYFIQSMSHKLLHFDLFYKS